jgi:hypothetical protein
MVPVHQTKETVMTNQPGLDNRHRDKNGEIARKHGNTLISTLRKTYDLWGRIRTGAFR